MVEGSLVHGLTLKSLATIQYSSNLDKMEVKEKKNSMSATVNRYGRYELELGISIIITVSAIL